MARCLIVACGCRGLSLTAELKARGHTVRGTTRNPARRLEIESAGAEPFVGDPDRVVTLAPALDHVAVACLLLGSASGPRERLQALFSTRLDMLLQRMLDTTVHGVVYESSGIAPEELLGEGAQRVRAACERSLIPFVLLAADPVDHSRWPAVAADAVQRALLGSAPAA
jgi:uncharacterized protein YbjT (DUF2867 family)